MLSKLFEKFESHQVTDAMLEDAAELFSQNYGIWGERPSQGLGPRQGRRVRLKAQRLRSDYLVSQICAYAKVSVDCVLAGNVFVCRWTHNDQSMCWITQLVVHRDYREQGLASGLLNEMKEATYDVYGTMSSHPAAYLAAVKAFWRSFSSISPDFVHAKAKTIMASSPTQYIVDARPCGHIFTPDDTSGLISAADTKFYVDHKEPSEALHWIRQNIEWPLGALFDGYEFLLVITAKRARSRARQQLDQ